MRLSRGFRRVLIRLALLAIPAGLLGLAALLYGEFQEIRQVRNQVDASVETRAALAQLLSENQDIETSTRGYVLTGQPEFLDPFDAAKARLPVTFRILRARAVAEPDLSPSLNEMRSLTDRKLDRAQEAIALVRDGDFAGARAVVASGRGKVIMDRLRQEISAADERESDRLSRVTNLREGSRIDIEQISYLLLLSFALLLAFVATFAVRSIRERQTALARVQALDDALDERIGVRCDRTATDRRKRRWRARAETFLQIGGLPS